MSLPGQQKSVWRKTAGEYVGGDHIKSLLIKDRLASAVDRELYWGEIRHLDCPPQVGYFRRKNHKVVTEWVTKSDPLITICGIYPLCHESLLNRDHNLVQE